MRDNTKEEKRVIPGIPTPPRAWEINFLTDHFEERRDNGFGISAQYRGAYSYTGGMLTLLGRGENKGEPLELKIDLSGDRMTMHNDRFGWNIQLERSEEPIPYLEALPKMPHTIGDAVSALKNVLKEDDLKTIRDMKKEDLICILGWGYLSEMASTCGVEIVIS